ncbi:hypothetical protein MSI_07170 [Treponema sp. JC4]|uniref:NADase-type glycan-binding domain-containing protein n=1 Tax=Treponema sp. JC4 TaxID=1124982 RepID=UPI00025B04D0|nr:hypothetical protein [Treponema sp. JC4]EID86364.1 hypothetical protein MSI_07170 [Treponema sp. JC4]
MKKIISIIIFILLTINAFCFDFDKDNFSVELDLETALFVYENKIYILGWDGKLWSDDRPEKIINEYGYPVLNIKENPYYGRFIKKSHGTFLLDFNEDIFSVEFFDNDNNRKELIDIYKENDCIKSIKASSELTEIIKNNKTVYSVENVLTVAKEKESDYCFRTIGMPWVPDIKYDKTPYIDFELTYEHSSIHILPGFIDFSRQHLWKQNARPKTIEIIDLSNSESLGKFTIEDKIKFTSIQLGKNVTKVRIKFLDFYPGSKYQDPCVAAIYFGTDKWPASYNYGKKVFEKDGYFIKILEQQE